jgi:hypothetical protein
MTSFIKSIFGSNSLGTSGKAPSFNDFSMHAGDDGARSPLAQLRACASDFVASCMHSFMLAHRGEHLLRLLEGLAVPQVHMPSAATAS